MTQAHIEAGCRRLFEKYRQSAARRALVFTVTIETFASLTAQPCAYCDREPSQSYRHTKRYQPYTYTGIDRVNNDRGYEDGNMAPCCADCNRRKATKDAAEFAARRRAEKIRHAVTALIVAMLMNDIMEDCDAH